MDADCLLLSNQANLASMLKALLHVAQPACSDYGYSSCPTEYGCELKWVYGAVLWWHLAAAELMTFTSDRVLRLRNFSSEPEQLRGSLFAPHTGQDRRPAQFKHLCFNF